MFINILFSISGLPNISISGLPNLLIFFKSGLISSSTTLFTPFHFFIITSPLEDHLLLSFMKIRVAINFPVLGGRSLEVSLLVKKSGRNLDC
jgi:hypothetical protein